MANEVSVIVDGKYAPARPLAGGFDRRLRAAWLALTGKADAVIWPGGQ